MARRGAPGGGERKKFKIIICFFLFFIYLFSFFFDYKLNIYIIRFSHMIILFFIL